jgi:hypothetical protein
MIAIQVERHVIVPAGAKAEDFRIELANVQGVPAVVLTIEKEGVRVRAVLRATDSAPTIGVDIIRAAHEATLAAAPTAKESLSALVANGAGGRG